MRTGQEGRRAAPGTPGAGCSCSARRTPARGAIFGQNRPRSCCPGPCAPCTGAAAQVRGAIRNPVCGGSSVTPVVTIGGPPPLRGTIRMPAGIGIASPIRGRRVHPRQALGRGGHLPPPPCPEPPSGRAGRIGAGAPIFLGRRCPFFPWNAACARAHRAPSMQTRAFCFCAALPCALLALVRSRTAPRAPRRFARICG